MIAGVSDEIRRIEYTLASISVDHGRGPNPHNLDVAFNEKALVLLRAYRDLMNDRENYLVAFIEESNMAETDPVVSAIRLDIITPTEQVPCR